MRAAHSNISLKANLAQNPPTEATYSFIHQLMPISARRSCLETNAVFSFDTGTDNSLGKRATSSMHAFELCSSSAVKPRREAAPWNRGSVELFCVSACAALRRGIIIRHMEILQREHVLFGVIKWKLDVQLYWLDTLHSLQKVYWSLLFHASRCLYFLSLWYCFFERNINSINSKNSKRMVRLIGK